MHLTHNTPFSLTVYHIFFAVCSQATVVNTVLSPKLSELTLCHVRLKKKKKKIGWRPLLTDIIRCLCRVGRTTTRRATEQTGCFYGSLNLYRDHYQALCRHNRLKNNPVFSSFIYFGINSYLFLGRPYETTNNSVFCWFVSASCCSNLPTKTVNDWKGYMLSVTPQCTTSLPHKDFLSRVF